MRVLDLSSRSAEGGSKSPADIATLPVPLLIFAPSFFRRAEATATD